MTGYRFLNWGTTFSDSSSLKRQIIISNKIGVILFLLSICLEIAYVTFYPVGPASLAILVIGLTSLITVFFNKLGFINYSRFWLSISITLATLLASLYVKTQNYAITQEYDYFNYRIMMMAVSVLPAILFTVKEIKSLLFCLLFSVIVVVFF